MESKLPHRGPRRRSSRVARRPAPQAGKRRWLPPSSAPAPDCAKYALADFLLVATWPPTTHRTGGRRGWGV